MNNIENNTKEKESILKSLKECLRAAMNEFQEILKNDKEARVKFETMKYKRDETIKNSETELLKINSKISKLKEALNIQKSKYEKDKDELKGKINIIELQSESFKQQIEGLKGQKETLKNIHKEQEYNCKSFFAEAIQPLELVIHFH